MRSQVAEEAILPEYVGLYDSVTLWSSELCASHTRHLRLARRGIDFAKKIQNAAWQAKRIAKIAKIDDFPPYYGKATPS
jgi:hypothetical protein